MTSEPAARARRRRRWVALLTFAVALWLGLSYVVAHRSTRRKRPPFSEPIPAVDWATFEPVRLRTHDGESIGGWYAPGRADGPSVLLLHPNGGSRRSCLDQAEVYARRGASLLLISLRAHGDSTGERHDFGLSARADVAAAVDELAARRPGRPILIHGLSLGSAAALFASAELGRRVSGYVLEGPFRDLRTAVRNRTAQYLPPLLDLVAYAGLIAVAPVVLPEVDRIAPVEASAGIPGDIPVLILAGAWDVKARPAEARAIRDRIGDSARLVVFERSGHIDLLATDPARYKGEIQRILDRLRPPQPDPASPGHAPDRPLGRDRERPG